MKRTTLKEVAALAGVSVATVSNLLNGTKNVSDDVKDRIYKSIEELDYQPNIVAKSLRVKKSNIIGVLISDISNDFFANIVRGIEEELGNSNYSMLLSNTDNSIEKERKYLDLMIGQRVDGLIISSAGNTGEYFKSYVSAGVPIVFLNRSPKFIESEVIMTNNIQGSYSATEHLIRHGYKKIAIITGPSTISTGSDRLVGYRRALEDYGITLIEDLVKEGEFTIQSGYDMMKELMQRGIRPDAIFISNNKMSLGAYKYCKEHNVTIPRDIAIIGYDESDWADVVEPPLTTVSQPTYQLGVRAAHTIMSKINNKQVQSENLYMDTRLIIRNSCGC